MKKGYQTQLVVIQIKERLSENLKVTIQCRKLVQLISPN